MVFHHTSRKTSRRDIEAPETFDSLGSFKVSASVLEAATSRLGLISVSVQKVSCTSLFITNSLYHERYFEVEFKLILRGFFILAVFVYAVRI